MSEVLAAIAFAEPGEPVSTVARALGEVMQAQVRQFGLPEYADPKRSATLVLQELGLSSTLAGVLAAHSGAHAACWRVVQRATKPVVLVPPALGRRWRRISRVLLPLNGTAEATAAIGPMMDLLASAGVDLVVLHVFDVATVPRFWDQAAHAQRAWEEEFIARHAAAVDTRLEVRHGAAGDHVVDVAESEGADLIAMGWSQRLDAGRARTVRRSVRGAGVPVMLVPVADRTTAVAAD